MRRGVNLESHLMKAGVNLEKKKVSLYVFSAAIIVNLVITAYLFWKFSVLQTNISSVITTIMLLWTIIFVITLFLSWLILYLMLDLFIFQRHKSLEEVLPDYLQLVAANMRAGMGPDQAMYKAVRPEFGVLSKEIEHVAKDSFSGRDLSEALNDFAQRYDSKMLKDAVHIIIEGIQAGSQLEDILNSVAKNIQEARTLSKEMSANVTTYAIFIGFAVICGAPILLALSKNILIVIQTLTAGLTIPTGIQIPITIGDSSISPADFQIFSIVMIILTSITSSLIMAMIMKGNIKESPRYITLIVPAALAVYFIATYILSFFIGAIVGQL